jgi:hypothetical protein
MDIFLGSKTIEHNIRWDIHYQLLNKVNYKKS